MRKATLTCCRSVSHYPIMHAAFVSDNLSVLCNTHIFSVLRHVHEQLTHAVQEAVCEQSGSECLLLIVDALREEGTKVLSQAEEASSAQAHAPQQQMHKAQPNQIGRRSIWYALSS